MLKQNKGITLVALVITIIVLLILAGVSISLVVGDNGVLTQSQNAAKKTDLASANTALQLSLTSLNTNFMGEVWTNNVNAELYENVTVAKLDSDLQKNGYYIVKYNDTAYSATVAAANVASDDDEANLTKTITISQGTTTDTDRTTTNTTYTCTLVWSATSVKISVPMVTD